VELFTGQDFSGGGGGGDEAGSVDWLQEAARCVLNSWFMDDYVRVSQRRHGRLHGHVEMFLRLRYRCSISVACVSPARGVLRLMFTSGHSKNTGGSVYGDRRVFG